MCSLVMISKGQEKQYYITCRESKTIKDKATSISIFWRQLIKSEVFFFSSLISLQKAWQATDVSKFR